MLYLNNRMEKTELYLGLARCTFLTCREKQFLAENLDNIEALTVLSIEDICYKVGRSIKTRCWHPENLVNLVQKDCELMRKFGIDWVSILDPEYPPLLRELHDAPYTIFWRGTLPDPERPLVAIVGTRSPTGDGSLAAERIARDFVHAGVSIVSGLARGIDAFAHRGTIAGGGATVAVLACGLDKIYPRSNAHLASVLVESGGCLLGEYPPGDEPLKYRFPQRNRIISGLSRAVLVIEAPEKSGALITADFALEQGRDLFVYRGTLHSSRSAGCRNLFSQGAPAVSEANDILVSWGFSLGDGKPADLIKKKENTLYKVDNGISLASSIGRQLALDFRKEITLHE